MEPGANPNTLNAKRRSIRPRVKNQPREDTERGESLKWVEPLATPIPINGDLTSVNSKVDSIVIELNEDLPDSIFNATGTLFETVMERIPMDRNVINRNVDQLWAQTYFKCAKQLYSTLDDEEKSRLQPLKAVFYDTSDMPKILCHTISMIGNFSCKIGHVKIQDAPVLFKRWVATGINTDPYTANIDMDPNPLSLVWRDHYSKQMIDRMIIERCQTIADEDRFEIIIGAERVIVNVPDISRDFEFPNISDRYPRAQQMRALHALLNQTTEDYIAGEQLDHGQQINEALDALGLHINARYTDAFMRDRFERCVSDYMQRCRVNVSTAFEMEKPPSSGKGFASQMVSVEGLRAKHPLPLADSDLAFGYAYSPAKKVIIDTEWNSYGREMPNVVRSHHANKDLRAFARNV